MNIFIVHNVVIYNMFGAEIGSVLQKLRLLKMHGEMDNRVQNICLPSFEKIEPFIVSTEYVPESFTS